MKKLTMIVAVMLAMSAGSLYAQSSTEQNKTKQSTTQGTSSTPSTTPSTTHNGVGLSQTNDTVTAQPQKPAGQGTVPETNSVPSTTRNGTGLSQTNEIGSQDSTSGANTQSSNDGKMKKSDRKKPSGNQKP